MLICFCYFANWWAVISHGIHSLSHLWRFPALFFFKFLFPFSPSIKIKIQNTFLLKKLLIRLQFCDISTFHTDFQIDLSMNSPFYLYNLHSYHCYCWPSISLNFGCRSPLMLISPFRKGDVTLNMFIFRLSHITYIHTSYIHNKYLLFCSVFVFN